MSYNAIADHTDIAASLDHYGVSYEGLQVGHEYHEQVQYDRSMTLAEVSQRNGRITRVRILGGGRSDGYMADISYVHATLPDGTIVPLHADYPVCFPIRKVKGELIEWAKYHGVYAKGLGLLDESNWSILR